MKRFFSAMVLLLAVLLISNAVCGCVPREGGDATTDNRGAVSEITTVGQSITDPVTSPQEPIEISTPGGVVLVGSIEKDECYYFIPREPLNVEYTGIDDKTLIFNSVNRFDMFDSDIDGIDKACFVGREVTVSGILRIVRDDLDRLYLHAYSIEYGASSGQSRAEPDVTPPVTEPITVYDPSVPVPDKMKPLVENGRYVYNPYRLTTEALESMGNGFADFYIDVIDAVLDYKSFVACGNDDYAMMLSTVLYYEFPLYGITFDCEYADGGVSLRYLVSREEQEKISATLFECINGYLKNVGPEQSEQVKAEAVYHALCTSVSYDDAAAVSRQNISAYYAYVEKTGICVTFAAAYSQLLTQIGIENTTVSGSNDRGDGHAWNLVTIDGKKYFCDPTFELGWNGGSAFVYFGQTVSDRESNGYAPEKCTVGKYVITSVADAGVSERALQIVPLQ